MSLREKLRVMVVDDMSTSRGLITQALDAMGIQNIATAGDGKSALAALQQSPVHLVISDYNMPEMDGLHLLHYLRSAPATQKTGFLLITGRADPAVEDVVVLGLVCCVAVLPERDRDLVGNVCESADGQ